MKRSARLSRPKRCLRCGGLMWLETHRHDGSSTAALLLIHACVNCGDRIDAIILRNRARRPGLRAIRPGSKSPSHLFPLLLFSN